MIGPSPATPGGMSAVLRCYRQVWFSKWGIEYLSSYEGHALPLQGWVMGGVLLRLLTRLLLDRVALVHLHSASRGSFWRKSLLCWLADAFGVPYVYHLHSGEFPAFYRRQPASVRKWVRRTLRRAACVVVLTEGWRAALATIEPGARIEVVGNPVSVPKSLPAERFADRCVLFLGRFDEKKGIFDLVRAVPKVLEALPDTTFVLAGDGRHEEVRRFARELGVEKRVRLPGWLDGETKEAALAAASVVVLPSYCEGLPVSLLEAMAAGVSVVATRVGGIPELLREGECGMLVEPGDVVALATALVEVLKRKELRERLRENAFAQVRGAYSEEVVFGKLDELYRGLLEEEASIP
ncbi:MAG TPA: glycosyltransferase family 4 protein [Methylococcus sp.]|nr:glycosyltransferase family 4 protein [Methylococcus sp.]